MRFFFKKVTRGVVLGGMGGEVVVVGRGVVCLTYLS